MWAYGQNYAAICYFNGFYISLLWLKLYLQLFISPTMFAAPCRGCLITWHVQRKRKLLSLACLFHKQIPAWNTQHLSCLFSRFVLSLQKALLGPLCLLTHTWYLSFNKHISLFSAIWTNSHQCLHRNIAVAAELSGLLTSKHLQLPDRSLSGAID